MQRGIKDVDSFIDEAGSTHRLVVMPNGTVLYTVSSVSDNIEESYKANDQFVGRKTDPNWLSEEELAIEFEFRKSLALG